MFMAQFLYPPPPALPGACFRSSASAALMSESLVFGLNLLTASEGWEYEYLKKAKFEVNDTHLFWKCLYGPTAKFKIQWDKI